MKKIYSTFVVFLVFILTACNGPSGANTEGTEIIPSSLTLATYTSEGNEQQSFDSTSVITLKATLYDQNNKPLAGQKIDFTASLGELSVSAKLTDSNGEAVVTLSNPDALLGAGIASVSLDKLARQVNYEFINNAQTVNLPQLSNQILLNDIAVNQFKTDQTVQVLVQLTDNNNQAIANEIIDFNAEIGSLSAPSALTNATGIATVTLTGGGSVGAGVLTATHRNTNISQQLNYEVLAADAVIVDSGIRIGSFDSNNQFNEGVIAISVADNAINAGGTLGLRVDLIDINNERVQAPTPVSFTSNCVANNDAVIDQTVYSIAGSAQATFEDLSCAGTSGTTDVIVAKVSINGIEEEAYATITIQGEQLGAIEFISAQPTSIVLKGTGGQGTEESSLLTFKVKSELGNAIPQQTVDFTLNTEVGDIVLSPLSGVTNSQGLVTTRVAAGTVPTAVRVTAKSSLTQNNETVTVQTQSDLLSINTGLPEQRSLTLAASVLNPEADFSGETSTITAWLADNFNNPVPDGTTVNFTTEGGVIEPSCTTVNGSCSVTWTSAEPRVDNHRVTILASAVGHESFFDTNGNNSFDNSDGSAVTDMAVSSGFGRITPQASGFIDMTEAWRDDNENATYDAGELFLDFNNNNTFDNADSLFNGPQCSGALCAANESKSINVRKALVLIMSSSSVAWELRDTNSNTLLLDSNNNGTGISDLADGASQNFTLLFSDSANQPLPKETQISVRLSSGEITGTTDYRVPNSNVEGKARIQFTITNPTGGDPQTTTLTINYSTPKGVVTTMVESFTLE